MENFDIVTVTKETANNMHALLIQLADHIGALELEVAYLKQQLADQSNDIK